MLSHSDRNGRPLMTAAGLIEFYRDMTAAERHTFWACFCGWWFDGLDFTIYPLIIGTIVSLWLVSAQSAGLAVTVALLSSAVGGWFVGYLSDHFGRVRTLQLTILWFGIGTLLCGLAQNFTQLLIFRAILGFGFGGEWAAGTVLMGETIRPQYRGRALGCIQSAWAVGWGAAVVLQAIMFSVLKADIAWRAMCIFGSVPCLLLLFYIERNVREPTIAVKARGVAEIGRTAAIWDIFAPKVRRTTLLASVAFTGAQGGYYAINTWLPLYLEVDRGLTIVGSSGYLASLIIGSFCGYLVGARLADWFGRRMLFLVFSAASAATVIVYTQLSLAGPILLLLGFPLGFFSSGYYSGIGAFLTEIFPTRLRGSGQGFCYNFGRGFGALFPTFVGYLSKIWPLGKAMAIFAVIAYAGFFLGTLLLPETRGKVLDSDD